MQLSKRIAFYLFLIFNIATNNINGQVLKEPGTLQLVKQTVDNLYNMRFSEAAEACSEINRRFPDHPVIYLLKGMIIYWQNYPLLEESPERQDFERFMYLCIEKCETYEPENEAEFLLANLCARGGLLSFYTSAELHSKAFALGRSSYKYLKQSFKFTGTFPDFYFFTGLYKYYREAYPEAHPLYKPILSIFPRGNTEHGLNELRIAFRESIFMKAEAATFLSSIYKYFENDFYNAASFSNRIYIEYPRNTAYLINYIEDKLLMGEYDLAENIINSKEQEIANPYYRSQIIILKAIITEKKYENLKKAEQQYSEGIDVISGFSSYGKQYSAYAYFGLSRIKGIKNDDQNERVFRRKAMDLTSFGSVSFDHN
ncbi:MAG TPA: hypothetical protein VHO50_12905 [Bacteroidales bacterium]|nr:hypothetical protein [Bacteroidales bacterium]